MMTANDDKLTPAMRQFMEFKKKYPDAILFFRMGDFYETFYEDAQTCSRVLGLVLTSRSKGENPIPLAGLPFHALDGYLKKMLQAGYKVAVCEQVEDPKQAKGVVRRDVVRIVTPGTLTDDMLLNERDDNFLAAVSLGRRQAAIAWVDISTGHFFVQETSEKEVVDELSRLSPREILVAEKRSELFAGEYKKLLEQIRQLTGAMVTERPGWYFDPYSARQKLLKHFAVTTLEGFGIGEQSESIPAAGAILEYLEETQKAALHHIASIKPIERTNYLQIDQTSLRSLEVLRTMRSESSRGSLLECIDKTLTGMGSRMMRSWLCMPLRDIEPICRRQDAVGELASDDALCNQLRGQLKSIFDLERIVSRICARRVIPRDLVGLAATLRTIPALRQRLADCQSPLLRRLSEGCDSMDGLATLLESAIEPQPPTHLRDGGVIRDGFNPQLDRLRSLSRDGQTWLMQYQQEQIQKTGIANLKVGFNKVFGYYIEINHTQADNAPADYIRKQTVKNAERYITPQLKEYEEEALGAVEKSIQLEQQLFEQVREQTAGFTGRLQAVAAVIAQTDCLAALAAIARQNRWIRPRMTDGTELSITEGKHPVLAQLLGSEFVPNDVALGIDGADAAIITGPNMAGKSTYIRQVALLTLLAHTGSFIPAKEATIGAVDRIFTRVGASDELSRGQSTFMVEMTETANILNNATSRSLVILDEVGRGTSTHDGLSLAWAITEYIANTIRCRTLFATHYHELTALGTLLANVRNFNVAVREWAGEVVFLHKIIPGGADKSYGIHVAKIAGLPKDIIARSREILADLENAFANEAHGEKLSRHKTAETSDALFVQKHKSVLDKLSELDIDRLTPMEAMNLLHEIKQQLGE